jgi:hypothetical protein
MLNFMGCVLAQAEKKEREKKKNTIEFVKPICNHWGQTTSQKCSKLVWPQGFFQP